MRYELTDCEWLAIKPLLPNKPRGVPRGDDRRVLNGIFWVLRSGAPWRDLPTSLGPYTTSYNRFVRWRRAGVWSRIMRALATTHDASVQMIDTSIVRVHQHAACIARNRSQSMGRPRGGLSSKIHVVVGGNGLPVQLALTAGEAHDNRLAGKLLSRLKSGTRNCCKNTRRLCWTRDQPAADRIGVRPIGSCQTAADERGRYRFVWELLNAKENQIAFYTDVDGGDTHADTIGKHCDVLHGHFGGGDRQVSGAQCLRPNIRCFG
jgi:transposase